MALIPTALSYFFGWKDVNIMLLGLTLLMIACTIKINYYYADPMNQYQYYAGSALFYGSTTIVEASAMAIIAKTLPPRFALGYWNAGMLGGCAELLGRTCGNVAFTIYSLLDQTFKNRAQPFLTYTTDGVCIGIMLAVTIIFQKKLHKHMEIQIVHED